MISVLSHFPGNKVTIFLEVVDGYGRVDSITTPQIDGILFPDYSAAPGYPQPMGHVGTGLYTFQFVLPTGAASIGSYLVQASYSYQDGYSNSQLYQVVVTAPYGNFSTTVVG